MSILQTIKSYFEREPITWFTSDWHFSHRNIIKYCDRPWETVEKMDKALVKLWNKTVKPYDTVIFVGDFSLGWSAVEQITPILNGKKILVAGNHDKCFGWDGKPNEKAAKYIASGWDSVVMSKRMQLKNGMVALISHLPYGTDVDLLDDPRYAKHRPKRGNEDLLIHGHKHCKYLKSETSIDVGIDNNFKLLSEDDIVRIIKDPRKNIPARLTNKRK